MFRGVGAEERGLLRSDVYQVSDVDAGGIAVRAVPLHRRGAVVPEGGLAGDRICSHGIAVVGFDDLSVVAAVAERGRCEGGVRVLLLVSSVHDVARFVVFLRYAFYISYALQHFNGVEIYNDINLVYSQSFH